jgi:hypothetical protein
MRGGVLAQIATRLGITLEAFLQEYPQIECINLA